MEYMRSMIGLIGVLLSIGAAAADRPLIEQIDFGAYSCGACRAADAKTAKEAVIRNLREEATARGMGFRSVCVVIDTDDPAVLVPFGGEGPSLASPALARATAEEAARIGTDRWDFCVQISDNVLIHATRGSAPEPFETSEEYKAALADALKLGASPSICVSYRKEGKGYGRYTDVEERTRVSWGGRELQIGEAYRELACDSYDVVIHTGEGNETAEFWKYVTNSPAIVEPIELVVDGLPYSVQVRDQQVVLGRHIGGGVVLSSRYFLVTGTARERFYDCFLNPGKCAGDAWWKALDLAAE